MNEVDELAIEVFEGRCKAEERIKKEKKLILQDNIKKILNLFKISNLSENSAVLVWQIQLCKQESGEKTPIMISFDKGISAYFYNRQIFHIKAGELGDNEELYNKIEEIEIPQGLLEDIFHFFNNNLSEWFETTRNNSGDVYIELKTKINKN